MGKVMILVVSLVVMAGCANSPVMTESAEQNVFLAQGTYNAVAKTTADFYEQGVINRDLASDINEQLDKAEPVLESARETVRSDEPLSASKLDAIKRIQEVLSDYQTQLESQRRE